MKKLITSILISIFALSGVVFAQTVTNQSPASTTSTPGQTVNQGVSSETPGSVMKDAEMQIKVLQKEMEAKIKAIREEYRAKIDAIQKAAKMKSGELRGSLKKQKELNRMQKKQNKGNSGAQ